MVLSNPGLTFGTNPAGYHDARPPYPEATWEVLRDRAGLAPGIDIVEIGPGTGLATGQLLAHEPRRLVAVEPDRRLADFLREGLGDRRLQVIGGSFEEVELPPAAFDLVACATAFHWLDAGPALLRVRDLLRPGGALALWWNVFGDTNRADPFHEATEHLFAGQRSNPSAGQSERVSHALDVEARLAELNDAGFQTDSPVFMHWTLSLDAAGVRRLYETFSNVLVLPLTERHALLDGLVDVAERQFGGRVERNMTTAIYTARPVGFQAG